MATRGEGLRRLMAESEKINARRRRAQERQRAAQKRWEAMERERVARLQDDLRRAFYERENLRRQGLS